MSIDRLELDESGKDDLPLYTSSYYDGIQKTQMLQVTQKHKRREGEAPYDFITLTTSDAEALMIDIINWLNGE